MATTPFSTICKNLRTNYFEPTDDKLELSKGSTIQNKAVRGKPYCPFLSFLETNNIRTHGLSYEASPEAGQVRVQFIPVI